MSDCNIPCDACGYRVKVSATVVDESGDEVTGVEFTSPVMTFAGAQVALNADIAILSASWGKGIAEACGGDEAQAAAAVMAANT